MIQKASEIRIFICIEFIVLERANSAHDRPTSDTIKESAYTRIGCETVHRINAREIKHKKQIASGGCIRPVAQRELEKSAARTPRL